MFRPRSTLLVTSDEFDRLEIVNNLIFNNVLPTNIFEAMVAAVLNKQYVDWKLRSKIYKRLNAPEPLLADIDMLRDREVRKYLKNYFTKEVQLEIGDMIILPTKPLILASLPEKLPTYDRNLEIMEEQYVDILDFEEKCFKNITITRYYKNTSFAAYMYSNLLKYLKHTNDQRCWQRQMLDLMKRINLNDELTMDTFYKDSIEYNGTIIDCSFVPKYDVRNLKMISNKMKCKHNTNSLMYYNSFDPSKTHKVLEEHLNVFRTFPFKNGYYIDSNGGNIHYLNYHAAICETKLSTKILIKERALCNMDDIESIVENLSRQLNVEDAIISALYATNINEAALSLLVLRRLIGDVLRIKNFQIEILPENYILNWTSMICNDNSSAAARGVLLPYTNMDKNNSNATFSNYNDTPLYVSLINDIANSCGSKLGASFMCSSFKLPELALREIYKNLHSDAQKYVFLTILLQSYNYKNYRDNRDALNPIFGNETNNNIMLRPDYYPKNNEKYINSTINERFNSYTEYLIKPTDIPAELVCSPHKCLYLYEFSDNQLNELCRRGDTQLSELQMANFIALILQLDDSTITL